jgi:hypothetical protein
MPDLATTTPLIRSYEEGNGVPGLLGLTDVQGDAVLSTQGGGGAVLESATPGELVAAASGLLGLGAVTVRVWGRVALARQQRRTLTAVADTLAATGRSARARQRMGGEEWSIELDPHKEASMRRRRSGNRVESDRV